MKTTPYTYLIGWQTQNKWYYGVRFAKGCHPNDLWNPYKTSSKHVKKMIEENGNPDIIQIRKIFKDQNAARVWESKVLKKMNVIKDNRFINKSDNISIALECSMYKHTNETRLKKSMMRIGKKHSEETKTKIRQSNSGRKNLYLVGKKNPEHSKLMAYNTPNAKPVLYEGVVYNTKKEMMLRTGISLYNINKLIKTNLAIQIK